jgi:hypothetical protein
MSAWGLKLGLLAAPKLGPFISKQRTCVRSARQLLWSLRADVQGEKRILKFVCHHHPPFPGGGKSAILALQNLAGHDRRFPPCRMFVRQFLALVILDGAVVVDVKKIPGHLNEMHKFALGSRPRNRPRSAGSN